ncbi:hemolysin [Photobacterium ganghwense]|uniref:Hemolysin n=1 Tax=Photobacterium ganghwense TaxID=320778 RepID=A0A0J1HH14_9GAMM|nr:leukocidin family pore-forming toxin [Photobacterium ganghwense]KLV10900.1 hemolysin [Photobacterium ganghwense]PSU10914.1 hemolysin [Photobacterium ganghwense]QSV13018.1 leukocidin family pore-forming toxin [Photobacterium ganghwense]
MKKRWIAALVFTALNGTSVLANEVVESVLIDDVTLDGYQKKSYEVILESEAQLSPSEFRGSRVQMKLLVELFHNSHNGKKAARVVTLGNGYVPGGSGVKQIYDAPLLARFTQNYPVQFDYSIYQAGGTPIFSEDYSPQNEASDVSVSTTTVAPSIGLSVSGKPGEMPGFSASLNTQLGVAYTSRYSSKDYVTAVKPQVGNYRGTGVKWTTSLNQLYTNDYQYYGKWAGVYHYTDCYNENLLPEENFPRLIYGFKPKFQYVFTPDADTNEVTTTEMIVRAGMKQVQEGFSRSACTWSDYGTKNHYNEAEVRFSIDWDKLVVSKQ